MEPTTRLTRSLLAAVAVGAIGAAAVAAPSATAHDRPTTYQLGGDAAGAGNPVGSKFEGIGADQRRGRFYVSEVTGGEIHRGSVRSPDTQEWLAGDGRAARLLDQQPTSADRVLTTAEALHGRILYVDSKFDEDVATAPYEVITDPTR